MDDEITVLRTVTAVTACGAPTSQRVGIYALCDAGMLSAETTSANVSDIDGPLQQPTAILASGTASGLVSDRLVPLEAFHRRALAPTIAAAIARGPKAPTCKPTKNLPGSFAASASANGVVGRLLADCGLAHTDTTPASLHRWRITTTCISLEPTSVAVQAIVDNFMNYAA